MEAAEGERGPGGRWVLGAHRDVSAAARDPETFSSAVSRFLQIPNGLDGEEHARFRRLVDSFLNPGRTHGLEGPLREVATSIVASLPRDCDVDAVGELGAAYAVRCACRWLGWPASVEIELLEWMEAHHAASRSGDLARTTETAEWFDRIVSTQTDLRREAGGDAPDDVTTELVRSAVEGRPLREQEIVSILRNWTGGDLGSMALCVGVIARQLADRPDVQTEVRRRVDDPAAMDRAVDELLRLDDPFVSSRRVTTREVTLGDHVVPSGQRVVLDWTAANRDPDRFADPDGFAPEKHASDNLVWGTGPHVCPGRPLATLELRVLLEELLAATRWIEPGGAAVRELPPLGGYHAAPVRLLG